MENDPEAVPGPGGDCAHTMPQHRPVISPGSHDWPVMGRKDQARALLQGDDMPPALRAGPLFHQKKFSACIIGFSFV